MAQIDRLLKNYTRYVELPWGENLDGKQRVWFAVYPPAEERRLRVQFSAFDLATKAAGHGWSLVDLTDVFPDWLAGYEHFQDYLGDPDSLAFGLPDFRKTVVEKVAAALRHPKAENNSVVALHGMAPAPRPTLGADETRMQHADIFPIRGFQLVAPEPLMPPFCSVASRNPSMRRPIEATEYFR